MQGIKNQIKARYRSSLRHTWEMAGLGLLVHTVYYSTNRKNVYAYQIPTKHKLTYLEIYHHPLLGIESTAHRNLTGLSTAVTVDFGIIKFICLLNFFSLVKLS